MVVLQVFSAVRAAKAAPCPAATAAAPAVPHITELHSSNETYNYAITITSHYCSL